jgi:hypothetical protein
LWKNGCTSNRPEHHSVRLRVWVRRTYLESSSA